MYSIAYVKYSFSLTYIIYTLRWNICIRPVSQQKKWRWSRHLTKLNLKSKIPQSSDSLRSKTNSLLIARINQKNLFISHGNYSAKFLELDSFRNLCRFHDKFDIRNYEKISLKLLVVSQGLGSRIIHTCKENRASRHWNF